MDQLVFSQSMNWSEIFAKMITQNDDVKICCCGLRFVCSSGTRESIWDSRRRVRLPEVECFLFALHFQEWSRGLYPSRVVDTKIDLRGSVAILVPAREIEVHSKKYMKSFVRTTKRARYWLRGQSSGWMVAPNAFYPSFDLVLSLWGCYVHTHTLPNRRRQYLLSITPAQEE